MAKGAEAALRALREAKYAALRVTPIGARSTAVDVSAMLARILELEAEVARLKRELALRPVTEPVTDSVTRDAGVTVERNGRNAPQSTAERQRAYRARRKGAK